MSRRSSLKLRHPSMTSPPNDSQTRSGHKWMLLAPQTSELRSQNSPVCRCSEVFLEGELHIERMCAAIRESPLPLDRRHRRFLLYRLRRLKPVREWHAGGPRTQEETPSRLRSGADGGAGTRQLPSTSSSIPIRCFGIAGRFYLSDTPHIPAFRVGISCQFETLVCTRVRQCSCRKVGPSVRQGRIGIVAEWTHGRSPFGRNKTLTRGIGNDCSQPSVMLLQVRRFSIPARM